MFVQPGDRFHSKSDGNGAANKYTIVTSAGLWDGEEGVEDCGERFLRRSFLAPRRFGKKSIYGDVGSRRLSGMTSSWNRARLRNFLPLLQGSVRLQIELGESSLKGESVIISNESGGTFSNSHRDPGG